MSASRGRGQEDPRPQGRRASRPRSNTSPCDGDHAAALFQVISRRYEKGSIILTTNRNVAAWGDFFSDTTIAVAIANSTATTPHTNTHGGISTIASPSASQTTGDEDCGGDICDLSVHGLVGAVGRCRDHLGDRVEQLFRWMLVAAGPGFCTQARTSCWCSRTPA